MQSPVVLEHAVPLHLGQLRRLGVRVHPPRDDSRGIVGDQAGQLLVGKGRKGALGQGVVVDAVEELGQGLVLAGEVYELLLDGRVGDLDDEGLDTGCGGGRFGAWGCAGRGGGRGRLKELLALFMDMFSLLWIVSR